MYKRHFLTAEENSVNVKYNDSVGIYHAILREPSPVDVFHVEHCKPSNDSMESISLVDPLIMLFNQERLSNLGEMGATAFLDSLMQRESSLSELRKKVSDDDLCAMIKSRYLQTPSEVTAWCRYIQGNVDAFNREVQALVESKKQETTIESTSNVESQTS